MVHVRHLFGIGKQLLQPVEQLDGFRFPSIRFVVVRSQLVIVAHQIHQIGRRVFLVELFHQVNGLIQIGFCLFPQSLLSFQLAHVVEETELHTWILQRTCQLDAFGRVDHALFIMTEIKMAGGHQIEEIQSFHGVLSALGIFVSLLAILDSIVQIASVVEADAGPKHLEFVRTKSLCCFETIDHR